MNVRVMRLSVSVLILFLLSCPVFAQSTEEGIPSPQHESSPPMPPASLQPSEEPTDPITALGELRRAVRRLPSDVNLRLKLSQSLLQVGDLAGDVRRLSARAGPHHTVARA